MIGARATGARGDAEAARVAEQVEGPPVGGQLRHQPPVLALVQVEPGLVAADEVAHERPPRTLGRRPLGDGHGGRRRLADQRPGACREPSRGPGRRRRTVRTRPSPRAGRPVPPRWPSATGRRPPTTAGRPRGCRSGRPRRPAGRRSRRRPPGRRPSARPGRTRAAAAPSDPRREERLVDDLVLVPGPHAGHDLRGRAVRGPGQEPAVPAAHRDGVTGLRSTLHPADGPGEHPGVAALDGPLPPRRRAAATARPPGRT